MKNSRNTEKTTEKKTSKRTYRLEARVMTLDNSTDYSLILNDDGHGNQLKDVTLSTKGKAAFANAAPTSPSMTSFLPEK